MISKNPKKKVEELNTFNKVINKDFKVSTTEKNQDLKMFKIKYSNIDLNKFKYIPKFNLYKKDDNGNFIKIEQDIFKDKYEELINMLSKNLVDFAEYFNSTLSGVTPEKVIEEINRRNRLIDCISIMLEDFFGDSSASVTIQKHIDNRKYYIIRGYWSDKNGNITRGIHEKLSFVTNYVNDKYIIDDLKYCEILKKAFRLLGYEVFNETINELSAPSDLLNKKNMIGDSLYVFYIKESDNQNIFFNFNMDIDIISKILIFAKQYSELEKLEKIKI